VHALRNVHRMLVDGGLVLDLHPIPPNIRVHAEGTDLGPLDERRFFRTVRETEHELERTVREGLFELETSLEFDLIERFASRQELFDALDAFEEAAPSKRLLTRLRKAEPPYDFHEHMILHRYRAL